MHLTKPVEAQALAAALAEVSEEPWDRVASGSAV
jgi:hypothetical protein